MDSKIRLATFALLEAVALFSGCSKSSGKVDAAPAAPAAPVSTLNHKGLITAPELPNTYAVRSPEREKALTEYPALAEKFDQVERAILAPALEDLEGHPDLLGRLDAGIVRIKEGGTFSFHLNSHDNHYGADLGLDFRKFDAGGSSGRDFGFMADLGTLSLDQVTFPDQDFAATYVAPSSDPETEYTRFHSGYVANGITYKSSLDISDGHAYLLRSIHYGSSDLLIAFQVLRSDSDGSKVLAWKLLKQFPVPLLGSQSPTAVPVANEDLNKDAVRIADRESKYKLRRELAEKMSAYEETISTPTKDDLIVNKTFLEETETGIARLLPPDSAGKLRSMGGKASELCFKEGINNCTDLVLTSDSKFSGVNAGADFGMLTGLQNLPIGTIDVTSNGVPYLANYVAPGTESAARDEQAVFLRDQVRTVGDHDYVGKIDAKNGFTYAIRSINYSYSDSLTAFQVVRKDADGSLIILYRRLQTNPVPVLR